MRQDSSGIRGHRHRGVIEARTVDAHGNGVHSWEVVVERHRPDECIRSMRVRDSDLTDILQGLKRSAQLVARQINVEVVRHIVAILNTECTLRLDLVRLARIQLKGAHLLRTRSNVPLNLVLSHGGSVHLVGRHESYLEACGRLQHTHSGRCLECAELHTRFVRYGISLGAGLDEPRLFLLEVGRHGCSTTHLVLSDDTHCHWLTGYESSNVVGENLGLVSVLLEVQAVALQAVRVKRGNVGTVFACHRREVHIGSPLDNEVCYRGRPVKVVRYELPVDDERVIRASSTQDLSKLRGKRHRTRFQVEFLCGDTRSEAGVCRRNAYVKAFGHGRVLIQALNHVRIVPLGADGHIHRFRREGVISSHGVGAEALNVGVGSSLGNSIDTHKHVARQSDVFQVELFDADQKRRQGCTVVAVECDGPNASIRDGARSHRHVAHVGEALQHVLHVLTRCIEWNGVVVERVGVSDLERTVGDVVGNDNAHLCLYVGSRCIVPLHGVTRDGRSSIIRRGRESHHHLVPGLDGQTDILDQRRLAPGRNDGVRRRANLLNRGEEAVARYNLFGLRHRAP